MQIKTLVATRAFKYGGTLLRRGDVWTPRGLRNDDTLIRARFVVEQDATEVAAEVVLPEPIAPSARRQRGQS